MPSFNLKNSIYFALCKLRRYIKYSFIDLGNYRNTIVLAGSGRSGTTWVGDIINYQDDYRVMFEPFHAKKIQLLHSWNYMQYIRPECQDFSYLNPTKKILSGAIKDPWIDKFNNKRIIRKRIIKDIRANLYLKWIKINFPEIPIVLLLRHPCAVANSKTKLYGNPKYVWETHLDDYLIQDDLINDYLSPFRSEIENAQDVFDKYIFMWCIQNYIPLKQFNENEIHVLYYEDLCVHTEQAIIDLQNFLGIKYSSEVMEIAKKPSALSRNDSAIITGENLVNSWKAEITEEQKKRAKEIMSLFNMQNLYGDDSMPLMSGKKTLSFFNN